MESEEREQDVWTDGAAWTPGILMGSGRGTTRRKGRAVEEGWCDPRGCQGPCLKGIQAGVGPPERAPQRGA